jgi:hypothetical protein
MTSGSELPPGSQHRRHHAARDERWAQDAVQQAMVRVWHDLSRLRDPDRFDARFRTDPTGPVSHGNIWSAPDQSRSA